MSDDPDLVVVARFSHPHEAHLACSALQAAGLDAVVRDAHIVAADWFLSNAVGGVKVLVRAEDAAAAHEVLGVSAAVNAEDEPVQPAAPDAGVCPRCGGTNVVTRGRKWRVGAFIMMMTSLPVFPVWRQRRCEDCGLAFR